MIIPEKLGRYKILEFLGSGSFGSVYYAEDTLLKKPVALKVQTAKAEKSKELIEEARTLFELNHENIVRFYNIEIIDDKIVLVMEPVRGQTLRDVIERQAPLKVEDALNIVKEVLKALDYAHNKGFVHGDIKPENILISEDGKIKLADFGLARILGRGELKLAIVGTPFYMAPEAWKGEVTSSSDIYSLGCILYELLTKRPPFYAESIDKLRYKVFNDRVERVPGVSFEVNELVKKMLSRIPAKRPSAGKVLSEVNKLLKNPEIGFFTVESRKKETFFGNLTGEQINFVKDPKDVVILKGIVGSGKTTSLAYKVAYEIKVKHEDPQHFLFLTFTGKAVNLFRATLEKLLEEENVKDITACTFHQFGQMVLRYGIERLGFSEDFRVITDKEAEDILKAFISLSPQAKTVLREIKLAKANLVTPEQLEAMAESEWTREVAYFYKRYQEELRRSNSLDYEDLILYAVELLKKHPDIRKDVEERFKFIVIDEFQDVNKALFELILLLKSPNNKLWVAGDEAQSIYGFRGASPVYLRSLEVKFPEASKHFLSVNFRTARKIVEAGLNLLSHSRENSIVRTLNTLVQEEGNVSISYFENEVKEAQFVAEKINELKEEGIDYTEIAVIYRTNEYSRSIEDALKKYEIPYTILEGESFYDLPEIKVALGFFNHYLGNYSGQNIEFLLKHFLKFPSDLVTKVIKKYEKNGSVDVSTERGEFSVKLKALNTFLSRLKRQANGEELPPKEPQEILEDIIDFGQTQGWFSTKSMETLQEFLISLQDMKLKDVRDVFNYVSLMREVGVSATRHYGVLLLTAHKAKGLEFNTVFITGLVEGFFPLGKKTLKREHLEEERRLLYVALTRAQKNLFLTYPLYYKNEKKEPSRFILELVKRR
jgi:DNA helicase-2/ATP-dependent DNA helicase PcrA